MRAQTDSNLGPAPRQAYPRAHSRAVTDLGAIARGEPRVAELLELLELATEPGRRIYILQEIARVYREDMDDGEAAAVALRAALQEDCTSDPVIAALEEIADEEVGWGPLLSELMEDATALGEDQPRRAADLWVRIALWYDDPVGYREYATQAVNEALELVPHHTGALAALAALLREGGHWLELVGVLERQAAVTDDEQAQIAIWLELADVADTHLGDHTTAIRACRSALDVDFSCQTAFDTLRSLLRRADAAAEIAELLEERAQLIADPDEYVELAVDIARIYGEQLGDPSRAERAWNAISDAEGAIARLTLLIESGPPPAERAELHYRTGWFWLRGETDEERAEWHFSQALAEHPGHVPSLKMLAEIYELRGDVQKASMMLARAAAHADSDDERCQLVLRSARIQADQLDDTNAAVSACEEALAAGPRHSGLTRLLATLYARQARWSELQPLLAELEAEIAGGEADPDELRALYYLVGRSAQELGNGDKALAYFYEARLLGPTDVDVLRGLADQYFARSDWKKAAREYHALLKAGPEPVDEAAIRYRLGVSLRAAGDDVGALDAFRRVVELEPDHLPAAEAVCELFVKMSRWRDAARAMRGLLELAPPDDLQRLRIELGDLHRDQLDEKRRALELYGDAVRARPDDHAALQRRLDVATELGEWKIAIDSIEAFAAAEKVAMRRGSYLHAAAIIHRDELRDPETAAALLERALDAFFGGSGGPSGHNELARCMKAFTDLDTLHTLGRAWTEQARSYRRMIKRLPPDNPLLADLWHALGEIYRSRLRRYPEAVAAFEVARALDPDNLERRQILAELYEITSGSPAGAADEHHAVLARDPGHAESYRALKEIYGKAGRMDQAWCACRALVFLEKATPDEVALFRRYQSHSLAELGAAITGDMHSRIVHPDEAGTVAVALAVVRARLAAARPARLGLRDAQRIDPTRDRRPRIRMLAHVALALDRPLPDVYDQTDRDGALAFALVPTHGSLRPVLVPRAHWLGAADKTAAHAAGRALSLLDPARVLSILFTPDELRSVLAWIAGEPDNSDIRSLLDKKVAPALRPDEREQLRQAQKALARTDYRADLERWLRAVTTTADRTGLLVSGDLHASARTIAASPNNPAKRILELLRYSVTDEHATIRRHLCGRI